MGRKANDGRGRLGGRTVGTKNKPKPALTEWIEGLLIRSRTHIEQDVLIGRKETIAALLIVSALNNLAEVLGDVLEELQGLNEGTAQEEPADA